MIQLLASYFFLAVEICMIHSIANRKKRRITYFFVLFLQFFVLAGFRGLEIHNDTLAYTSHFDNVSKSGHFWEIEKETFNPGYLVLEKFIHNNITDSILGFDVLTSFIICLCTFLLFYKRAKHMGIAIYLYFISGEYWSQVAVLREALAVLVGYLFMKEVARGKYIYAVISILLAVALHSSSFILFFLLLLMLFPPSKKMRVIIVVTTILVTYLIAPVMETVLNLFSYETIYFEEAVDKGFASANGILNGTIGILTAAGVFLMIKSGHRYRIPKLYKEILFLYFIVSIVALRLPIMSRYLMFFAPFIFIMVSNLAFVTHENRYYALVVAFVLAGNIIVKQLLRPEWISIFPYHFYNDTQLSMLHLFKY